MKKPIILIVVLALIAGAVAGWFVWLREKPPEQVVCQRLATLCGGEAAKQQCITGMQTIKKVVGQDALAKAGRCMSRAPSCVAATGCLTGVGANVLGDFIKGLVTGLDIDGKKLGQSLLGAIRSATETYGKVADGVASGLSAVKNAPKAALDAVGKQLDRAKGAAAAGVKTVKDGVVGAKDTVAAGIDSAKKTLDEQVKGVQKQVGAATDKIGAATDKVGAATSKVGKTIKDGVGSAIKKSSSLGRSLLNRVGLGGKTDAGAAEAGSPEQLLEVKLDAVVKKVEGLIKKKSYTRAALTLADIAWKSGTAKDAARDKQQAQRYLKKRQALRATIEKSL